jgi:hypothetical protein
LRLPDTLPDASGIPCHLVRDLSSIRLIPLLSPHCNVTLTYMPCREPCRCSIRFIRRCALTAPRTYGYHFLRRAKRLLISYQRVIHDRYGCRAKSGAHRCLISEITLRCSLDEIGHRTSPPWLANDDSGRPGLASSAIGGCLRMLSHDIRVAIGFTGRWLLFLLGRHPEFRGEGCRPFSHPWHGCRAPAAGHSERRRWFRCL